MNYKVTNNNEDGKVLGFNVGNNNYTVYPNDETNVIEVQLNSKQLAELKAGYEKKGLVFTPVVIEKQVIVITTKDGEIVEDTDPGEVVDPGAGGEGENGAGQAQQEDKKLPVKQPAANTNKHNSKKSTK